jgi:hypothetical protein
MKGTFFNRPLEWSLETFNESWTQGEMIKGKIAVKNHGSETINLKESGVALALADIKKVHTREEDVFKPVVLQELTEKDIAPNTTIEMEFNLLLPPNCAVSDKKKSFYITYGQKKVEGSLQLKIEPRPLFTKIISLLDTFYRFKLKEYKAAKDGVEYKLIPPASKDLAKLDELNLICAMEEEILCLEFNFQVKKLEMSGISTKIAKEKMTLKKQLSPKEYSLGKEMIHQDSLLKIINSTLAEVK